jgi:hypothetical protein
LITRVGDEKAAFAIIDNMDDDTYTPIPDSMTRRLEQTVGDRDERQAFADAVEAHGEIDILTMPFGRFEALNEPHIQGAPPVTDGGTETVDRLERLDDDQLVKCDNPYENEIWFLELVDGDVVRYHPLHDFETDTVLTPRRAAAQMSKEKVRLQTVDREELRQFQKHGLDAANGGVDDE